jgi:hypothetical protein
VAADTKTVIHESGQPIKILLQKTSIGYNWEIHVSGGSVAEILPTIRDANTKLAREYKGARLLREVFRGIDALLPITIYRV